jgi:hypothetical protein
MQRRHRILATLITIAAALGLAGIVIDRAAASRWQEVEAWRARAQRDMEARDTKRVPATGEARDGLAFAEYLRAFALAPAGSDWQRPIDTREDLPREEADALVRQLAPAVAAMRAGARSADARRYVDWKSAEPVPAKSLLQARGIVNVAVLQARALLAEARAREAVELLLDAATFGADYVHSPLLVERMIGCALTVIATGEAWRDDDLRMLDAAALELLDAGLARIDARLERAPNCLEGEALWLASRAGDLGWSLHAWRHGFSWRWQVADAVLRQAAACERLRVGTVADWPARQAQLAAEVQDLEASGNPLFLGLANLLSAEVSQRQALASVRLLRLAVAHHRGDDRLELRDPAGADLLERSVGERGVTFRSAAMRHDRLLERRAERR